MNILNISVKGFRFNDKPDSIYVESMLGTKQLKYYFDIFNSYRDRPLTERMIVRDLTFHAIVDIVTAYKMGGDKRNDEPFYLIYGFSERVQLKDLAEDEYMLELIESKTKFTPLHFAHDQEKIKNLKFRIVFE